MGAGRYCQVVHNLQHSCDIEDMKEYDDADAEVEAELWFGVDSFVKMRVMASVVVKMVIQMNERYVS